MPLQRYIQLCRLSEYSCQIPLQRKSNLQNVINTLLTISKWRLNSGSQTGAKLHYVPRAHSSMFTAHDYYMPVKPHCRLTTLLSHAGLAENFTYSVQLPHLVLLVLILDVQSTLPILSVAFHTHLFHCLLFLHSNNVPVYQSMHVRQETKNNCVHLMQPNIVYMSSVTEFWLNHDEQSFSAAHSTYTTVLYHIDEKHISVTSNLLPLLMAENRLNMHQVCTHQTPCVLCLLLQQLHQLLQRSTLMLLIFQQTTHCTHPHTHILILHRYQICWFTNVFNSFQ